MSNYIKMSDLRVLFLFNQGLHCLVLDIFMNTITQMGSYVFSIAVPLILMFSGQETLVVTGGRMAIVLIVSQTVVFLVKRLVHRPRPFKVVSNIINQKLTTCPYSFPSGHTCAAFSLAYVMAASFPGLGLISFSLASLVGLSRVYLGVHYPTDVIVGVMTAYGSFLLNTRIFF
jgi:undecaprenyl-diphosphatase